MSDNSNTQETLERRSTSEKRAKIAYSRIKRKILRRVWHVRIAIAILVVGAIYLIGIGSARLFENLETRSLFKFVSSFISAPNSQVASTNGRTNILIMGKAGGSHEGADLTDTMMVVSISFTKPEIVTISIPRDLWIPEIRAKINSAYYWGNQKNPGEGITFAKSITREVVGVSIHYGVVVDFLAFKDIIDALGGIQINVENAFTDKFYPIEGLENDLCGGDVTFACRYETISFLPGTQQMDGKTALKFVRSRHAEGSEGTDQSRGSRQQKVIASIKSKIMSPKIFLSPRVDLALLTIIKKYVQTDIDGPTAAIFARNIIQNKGAVKQNLIPEDLLENPPISGTFDKQYVFIPTAGNGNWKKINDWVSDILK